MKNELKIGELPKLKIIPSDSILTHEYPSQERLKKIRSAIESDGFLKNPLIVARLDSSNQYILLDGTNRFQALQSMGLKSVPVQLVDMESDDIEIKTWNHAISSIDSERFISTLAELTQQTDSEVKCADITLFYGKTLPVFSSPEIESRLVAIETIISVYRDSGDMDRVSYTNLVHLKKNYPDFSTLISFQPFSKNDIKHLSLNGLKIPGGITRIIVPKRALHLNIPLKILNNCSSTEEKNEWLRENLQSRIARKSIRFYQEPVFIFDD